MRSCGCWFAKNWQLEQLNCGAEQAQLRGFMQYASLAILPEFGCYYLNTNRSHALGATGFYNLIQSRKKRGSLLHIPPKQFAFILP